MSSVNNQVGSYRKHARGYYSHDVIYVAGQCGLLPESRSNYSHDVIYEAGQ